MESGLNGTARLLIIDDDALSAEELRRRLLPLGYRVEVALGGVAGLERLGQEPFDLVLLDVSMPGMDGYQVCRSIKEDRATGFLPVVMVTSLDHSGHKIKALEAGADDFLSRPVNDQELFARARSLLRLRQLHEELEQKIETRTRELTQLLGEVQRANEELLLAEEETILRLARAAESRDGETAGHLMRMSAYSELLARRLELTDAFCRSIRLASLMHDVGKIGIPDRLLHKPGRFTHEEREEMKDHPRLGAEILSGSRSTLLQMGERIALTHHEWFDGSGYPEGLRGEEIPIEGRIVALADFYDALASRRRYKAPLPADRILEMIRARSGTHFDPAVVDAFFEAIEEVLAIQVQFEEAGLELCDAGNAQDASVTRESA